MLLGKLDICLQKTETRTISFTLYNFKSKWIKDPNTNRKFFEASAGKSRKHTGSNRHRQGLPQ
jgi:hypothetical protein